MGPGPNGQPGRLGQPRAQQETDPLGRPLRGRDYGDDTTVKVPGEIDVQRARRILEELRRRFGENFRPQLELEYIERLLRDFLSPARNGAGGSTRCYAATGSLLKPGSVIPSRDALEGAGETSARGASVNPSA